MTAHLLKWNQSAQHRAPVILAFPGDILSRDRFPLFSRLKFKEEFLAVGLKDERDARKGFPHRLVCIDAVKDWIRRHAPLAAEVDVPTGMLQALCDSRENGRLCRDGDREGTILDVLLIAGDRCPATGAVLTAPVLCGLQVRGTGNLIVAHDAAAAVGTDADMDGLAETRKVSGARTWNPHRTADEADNAAPRRENLCIAEIPVHAVLAPGLQGTLQPENQNGHVSPLLRWPSGYP